MLVEGLLERMGTGEKQPAKNTNHSHMSLPLRPGPSLGLALKSIGAPRALKGHPWQNPCWYTSLPAWQRTTLCNAAMMANIAASDCPSLFQAVTRGFPLSQVTMQPRGISDMEPLTQRAESAAQHSICCPQAACVPALFSTRSQQVPTQARGKGKGKEELPSWRERFHLCL